MAATMRVSGSRTHAGSGRSTVSRRPVRRRGNGRAVLEVIALFIIAVLLILAPLISRSQAGQYETATVLTQPGDTLWTIAAEHPVPGLPTAQAVEIIAEINALQGSTVPTGMAVRVPLDESNTAYALK